MNKAIRRVFLSSTGRDLWEYREAVYQAINGLDDFKCVRMENFLARDRTPAEHCRMAVETCDVYVGLLGRLYGSLVPGEKFSYTEMEYDTAVGLGLHRLLFFADEGFPMSEALWNAARKGVRARGQFHKKAKADRLAGRFDFGPTAPARLAEDTKTALLQLILEQPGETPDRPSPNALPPRPDDLPEIQAAYLAHLIHRYSFLDFKGMGIFDRLPVKLSLLDLYVPLKARPAVPEGEKGGLEDLRLGGRRMTAEERQEVGGLGQPLPVLDLLQKTSGVVLLGDPGAGKSTFLKFLALSLAEGQGESLGLPGRLPFLIRIAEYAEALSRGSARLDHFVELWFREKVGDLALSRLMASSLAAGQALVLLDGLDEVRERELQRTVVARVQDFFSHHSAKGNRFVMTSRLVGYREVRLAVKGLMEVTLLDFDQPEIELFLEKWTRVQERAALGANLVAEASAESQRLDLLDCLKRNAAVRSLAANPLLLTILALMKRQGVSLPEQRVRLYEHYLVTLLDSWNRARGLGGQTVAKLRAGNVLEILRPLALWIHETSPGVGLVRKGALLERLEGILGEKYGLPASAGSRAEAEKLLEEVKEETGLLLDRGGEQYGFLHLTFLEYLAACEIANLDQSEEGREQQREAIDRRVGNPPWREVLLLTFEHMAAITNRRERAGILLTGLIEGKPGSPGEAELLAAQVVLDLGEAGVHPEVRKRVVGALLLAQRDDVRAPSPQRAKVGAALAAVGDPRPEVMTIAGMQFCWVPAGPFVMGSPDGEGLDRERPQHELEIPYGYWMGRYPVTVAQFRDYLANAEGVSSEERERPRGEPQNGPAGFVDWHEALRFCSWLTELQKAVLPKGWAVTLPSEAEWEKAARGGLRLPAAPMVAGWKELPAGGPMAARSNPSPDRRYPWGTEEDANRASYDETGIDWASSVGCFPGGVSPLGCEELSGNVWEWTRSLWGKDYRKPDHVYPYVPKDGREDLGAGDDALRVLRGGSCFNDSSWVRCGFRLRYLPDVRYDYIGFRVVVRPFFPGP